MSDSAKPALPPGLSERRSATRIPATRALEARLSMDLTSDILYLSSGGMMIRLPFPLEVGSTHGFTLTVEGEVIEASGIVRNCESIPGSGASPHFRVGVEFQGLGDPPRRHLEAFVEKKLKSEGRS